MAYLVDFFANMIFRKNMDHSLYEGDKGKTFFRSVRNGDFQLNKESCETVESTVQYFMKNVHKEEHEPFYLINLSQVEKQIFKWKELFPNIVPHYAVKANTDKRIIQLLHSHGCSFDCASKFEIENVIATNHLQTKREIKKKIIFAHPIKKNGDLKFAQTCGVKKTVVDSIEELEKLNSLNLKKFDLLIRIMTDDSGSVCRFSSKFGCDVEEAKTLIVYAQEHGLTIAGVCFHVGSGCKDPQSYEKALNDVKTLFDYGKEHDMKMNMIDIGGGFSDAVEDPKAEQLLKEISVIVHRSLNDLFFSSGDYDNNIQVIAEPGRFFSAPVSTLVVQIIGKKKKRDGSLVYYLSDGLYGSFNNIIFDHYEFDPIVLSSSPQQHEEEKKKKNSIFFGPTCDSLDIIWKGEFKELQESDILFFKNLGSYSISAASPFNGYITDKRYYYWEKTKE